MRAEYDFSKGKRGAILPTKGKTRITIYIDKWVVDEFRARAERVGTGYQTMMNDALKAFLSQEAPVTESVLRRVIREEVAGQGTPNPTPKRTRREASFCFASIPAARRLAS